MVLDALIKKPAALATLLYEISVGYKGITLIVDEANIALTVKESTSQAKIEVYTINEANKIGQLFIYVCMYV